MKEIIVHAWCDQHIHETREKVPAVGNAVLLSLDGVEVELDLCDMHKKLLGEAVTAYLDAGRAPERKTPLTPKRPYQQSPENRVYLRRMREFAKANGLSYITETGKYYYTKELRRRFARFLEEQARETEQGQKAS